MSQVDLQDHQDDEDGDEDEAQHDEIDNPSTPSIIDKDTETPVHPEPPQTLPTGPSQSLAPPEVPPSPLSASQQEQTLTLDNPQITLITPSIQLSDNQDKHPEPSPTFNKPLNNDKDKTKVPHNPAEREDSLEFDNESISNDESLNSSSHVPVPEGDNTVSCPRETPLSAIPLVKPKPMSQLKAPQNMNCKVTVSRLPPQKLSLS